jgi:hypothetical protein
MNKNLVFTSVSAVLLLMSSAIAISRHILPASANFLPLPTLQTAIYIKSDEGVEPTDAPIQQAENT